MLADIVYYNSKQEPVRSKKPIVVDSQNGNATYGDVYKIVEKDLPAAGFHLFPPKKRARLSSCPLGSA